MDELNPYVHPTSLPRNNHSCLLILWGESIAYLYGDEVRRAKLAFGFGPNFRESRAHGHGERGAGSGIRIDYLIDCFGEPI